MNISKLRALSIGAALILAVAGISGCGSKAKTPQATTSAASENKTDAKADAANADNKTDADAATAENKESADAAKTDGKDSGDAAKADGKDAADKSGTTDKDAAAKSGDAADADGKDAAGKDGKDGADADGEGGSDGKGGSGADGTDADGKDGADKDGKDGAAADGKDGAGKDGAGLEEDSASEFTVGGSKNVVVDTTTLNNQAGSMKEEVASADIHNKETGEQIEDEETRIVEAGNQNIAAAEETTGKDGAPAYEVTVKDGSVAPLCTQSAIERYLEKAISSSNGTVTVSLKFDKACDKSAQESYSKFFEKMAERYGNVTFDAEWTVLGLG